MKKLLLLAVVSTPILMANMMSDMATDAAMSKVKTEARSVAVKTVAGNDAMKKDLVNKAADEVIGKENPMDKMKSDALGSVVGSKTAMPDVGDVVKGAAPKETSMQDKAADMAVEKAVGSDPLKKEVAKSALKSII